MRASGTPLDHLSGCAYLVLLPLPERRLGRSSSRVDKKDIVPTVVPVPRAGEPLRSVHIGLKARSCGVYSFVQQENASEAGSRGRNALLSSEGSNGE